MQGADDQLKKTKELLKKLGPTQESVVTTSDHFLFLSHKELSEDLFSLWCKMFNLASSKQKLSFIYLLNHIVQNERKDEGRLKKLFKTVIDKVFEKAYKLSDDKDSREELCHILSIWKDRKVYEKDLVEKIENSLQVNNLEKPKKPPTQTLSSAYQKLAVPPQLTVLEENLRHIEDWEEKIDLIKGSLETIVARQVEYSEIETVCKLAEFERGIQLRKEYVRETREQLLALLRSEDNLHLQEVLQIKNMQEVIAAVKEKRAEYLAKQAGDQVAPSENNPASY